MWWLRAFWLGAAVVLLVVYPESLWPHDSSVLVANVSPDEPWVGAVPATWCAGGRLTFRDLCHGCLRFEGSEANPVWLNVSYEHRALVWLEMAESAHFSFAVDPGFQLHGEVLGPVEPVWVHRNERTSHLTYTSPVATRRTAVDLHWRGSRPTFAWYNVTLRGPRVEAEGWAPWKTKDRWPWVKVDVTRSDQRRVALVVCEDLPMYLAYARSALVAVLLWAAWCQTKFWREW